MIFQGEKMFDVFANNYDEVRPGYPQDMYIDINNVCMLDDKSRVIEIGAGSGIATVEIAKSGAKIIAIEPGANLVAIAEDKTKQFSNVEIVEAMFEDFQSSEKFDSLLALTSFHWISEETKYQKVYDLLSPEGCFAIVWNSFFQSEGESMKKINNLYHSFLPDIYPARDTNVNVGVFNKLNEREVKIMKSDLFYVHFLRKYTTVYNYDAKTYPMLLNTFPKIIKIEKDRREKFLKKVSEVVKKYGKISVPVLTTLLIAKKKDIFFDKIGKV